MEFGKEIKDKYRYTAKNLDFSNLKLQPMSDRTNETESERSDLEIVGQKANNNNNNNDDDDQFRNQVSTMDNRYEQDGSELLRRSYKMSSGK